MGTSVKHLSEVFWETESAHSISALRNPPNATVGWGQSRSTWCGILRLDPGQHRDEDSHWLHTGKQKKGDNHILQSVYVKETSLKLVYRLQYDHHCNTIHMFYVFEPVIQFYFWNTSDYFVLFLNIFITCYHLETNHIPTIQQSFLKK